MDDQKIYRWTAACGLGAIAVFLSSSPFTSCELASRVLPTR